MTGAASRGPEETGDLFTLQIVQRHLLSTVREMMQRTKASAHSTVFAEGEDFTCAILDRHGKLTFQAEGLGLHAGTFPSVIAALRECYAEIEPGDVFLHNDPYSGGAHQADVALVRGIFDGTALIGFVANRGHWSDIGGMAGGGWAGSATHVIQEALLIPPVRLWKGGALDEELARFLLANVRNSQEAWGTLQAQLASLITAEQRVHELIDKYSLATVEAATTDFLEYGRRRFVAGLEGIPDGEWSAEDFLDDDGTEARDLRIAVTVRKHGMKIEVDFSGTASQAVGPANTSLVNTRSAVLVALLSVVDPELPMNSGWFDLIDVSADQGTLVNPVYPAPMFHGTGAPMPRIYEVIIRALAGGVPERACAASYGTGTALVLAFGETDDVSERSWMHYTAGGGGARATRDGLNGVWWTLANCKIDSVEVTEERFPVLFESERWQLPSGGPGRTRGGLGIERRIVMLRGALATALNDRQRTEPWGLFGGRAGVPSSQRIDRAGKGEELSFDEAFGVPSPSKFANLPLREGDRLILQSGGGGGYGDPFARDPARVLEDVRRGYVSPAGATADYGVALSGDPLQVDIDATAKLRTAGVPGKHSGSRT